MKLKELDDRLAKAGFTMDEVIEIECLIHKGLQALQRDPDGFSKQFGAKWALLCGAWLD